MMKQLVPIKEYDAYLVQGNNVLGITKDSFELSKVEIKDEEGKEYVPLIFFRDDKTVYFKIQETIVENKEPVTTFYYFSQKNGSLKELKEDKFPSKPEPAHYSYKGKNFDVLISEWEGQPVSDIKNNYKRCGNPRFRMISGCIEGDDYLTFFINQSGKPGITTGLYMMAKTSASPTKIIQSEGFFC